MRPLTPRPHPEGPRQDVCGAGRTSPASRPVGQRASPPSPGWSSPPREPPRPLLRALLTPDSRDVAPLAPPWGGVCRGENDQDGAAPGRRRGRGRGHRRGRGRGTAPRETNRDGGSDRGPPAGRFSSTSVLIPAQKAHGWWPGAGHRGAMAGGVSRGPGTPGRCSRSPPWRLRTRMRRAGHTVPVRRGAQRPTGTLRAQRSACRVGLSAGPGPRPSPTRWTVDP